MISQPFPDMIKTVDGNKSRHNSKVLGLNSQDSVPYNSLMLFLTIQGVKET